MSTSTPPAPAREPALPDKMPESWIEQIKTAVKAEQQPIWLLILGSSVLAALVSGPISYWSNARVERAKLRLELEKEDLKQQQDAHNELAKALANLRMAIEGNVDLMQGVNKVSISKNPFKEQITQISSNLRAVEILRRDPRLAHSEVAQELIERRYLGGLAEVLVEMNDDWKSSLPKLVPFENQVNAAELAVLNEKMGK